MSFDRYAAIVIDVVRLHHVWAAPIVLAFDFLKSIVFFSMLVPAWAALAGNGALIVAGGIPLWACVDRRRRQRLSR
jgi:membrane protein DedA with SNARE-associated domain